MILGIRTDSHEAELYLYRIEGREIASVRWLADRELAHYLLKKIEEFLKSQNAEWGNIKGLFVFKGPGSFTGLRIGLTVMNTIAYSRNLPIVGGEGENWVEKSLERLLAGEDEKMILPVYGLPVRITKPKK